MIVFRIWDLIFWTRRLILHRNGSICSVILLFLNFGWISHCFLKNCPKISQNCHFWSFLGFGTSFFGLTGWFYIEIGSILPFRWMHLHTIKPFIKVPKFAQIPNWWRHTGSCVHFQTTRPLFLDSAAIFTLENVNGCYLVPKSYGFRIILYITVYPGKYTSFAKTPQVTSSTVGKYLQFEICVFSGCWNVQLWNALTSAKINIFPRGFFCSVFIAKEKAISQ